MTSAPSVDRQKGFWNQRAETMPPAEIRAMQEGIVHGLVQFCYENSSTYREKFEKAGITPPISSRNR